MRYSCKYLEEQFKANGLSLRELYPPWYRLLRIAQLRLPPPIIMPIPLVVACATGVVVILLYAANLVFAAIFSDPFKLSEPGGLPPLVLLGMLAVINVHTAIRIRRVRRKIGIR